MLRGFRKNLNIIIVVVAIAFIFTIFYGTFTRRSSNPAQSAIAAATVNNTVITVYDLENQFRNFISQFDNAYLNQLDEEGVNYLKRMTLESMINNELLYQEAKSRKIKVSNNEIDTRLDQYKANFPSDKEFQNYLQYQGIRINDLRESIKRDLMVNHLIDSLGEGIVIPPEDIQKYYEENQDLFSTPAQYHLYQMTFSTQDEADKIYKRVSLGEDFTNLAKSNSIDSYASNGGDAGWINEYELPSEAKDTIIELKDNPGTVTPVIKVGDTYQFFKVMEMKPAQVKPFDEVQEQIQTTLQNEQKRVKLEHLLAEIRQKSTIAFSETMVEAGIVEPSPIPEDQISTDSENPTTDLSEETTETSTDSASSNP